MENIIEKAIEKLLNDTTGKEFSEALCKFQGNIANIPFDSEVKGDYGFKYASLSAVIQYIRKPLFEAGLSFQQYLIHPTKVVTVVRHSSGQSTGTIFEIVPPATKTQYSKQQGKYIEVGLTSQDIGSYITYAKRYALVSILGLAADEDDDATIASGYVVSKTEEAKQATAKKTGRPITFEHYEQLLLAINVCKNLTELKKVADEISELNINDDWKNDLRDKHQVKKAELTSNNTK